MNREATLKLSAGIVIALFFFDKAVVGPLTAKWKKTAEKIAYVEEDVTKGEQLLKREDALRSRWADMRENAMPAERSETENLVLERIGNWAGDARMDISQYNPNWRDEDDHAKYVCRLEGSGDMEAVMRFLYDLDGDEQGIRVESLELISRDKSGRRLGVDVTLSGLELPPERKNR
ncbi:MAG: hypothetical protein CMO80_16820 [Verrucomicrobiales bacterium]|nr:hypothetical protein [Verrucomicrobiales bacterium]|tara:strand:- start:12 stop:539 length:528 start_codon:yes stop_codon:yes gene_type:complete